MPIELKSCTIPALVKIKGAYYIPNKSSRDYAAYISMEEKRMARNGYHHKRTSSHNGYLPPFYAAVIPYCGRWGEGYIIASHMNNSKVKYKYFIKG